MGKFVVDTKFNESVLKMLSLNFNEEAVNKHRKYITDILSHKQAFMAVCCELDVVSGKVGLLHDFDKILVALTAGEFIADNVHKAASTHHIEYLYNEHSTNELMGMIINLECADYTSKGRVINAYSQIQTLYSNHFSRFEELLKSLGLCSHKRQKLTFSKWESNKSKILNTMLMMLDDVTSGFLNNVDEYGMDEAIKALYEDTDFLPF